MGVRRVRLIVGVAVVGFLLALVLGSAGLLGGGRALAADTTLTIISGDVSVRHGTGAGFIVGVDGEVLKAGDSIKTAADARAVLTYFEGSTVTIEPGTELSIDEAFASQGSTRIRMTQNVGRTWHVVAKLIAGNSKYEVRTPASTASVRGTEFQVDTTGAETTITTTEGTVAAQVVDPVQPTQTIEVPVTPGNAQTQTVNTPPAQPHLAPPPERKVTVTVDASNSLIVDPLGRTNGVTADGRIVVQTPGAKVKLDNGKVVIEMPDIPDGRIAAHVNTVTTNDTNKTVVTQAVDVTVHTKVEEKGGATVEVEDKTKANAKDDKKGTTGFEIKKDSSGKSEGRKLNEDEQKSLPSGKHAEVPGNLTANTSSNTDNNSNTDNKQDKSKPDDQKSNNDRTETPAPARSDARPALPTKEATPKPDVDGGTQGNVDEAGGLRGRTPPTRQTERPQQNETDKPRPVDTDKPRAVDTEKPRQQETEKPQSTPDTGGNFVPRSFLPILPGGNPTPRPQESRQPEKTEKPAATEKPASTDRRQQTDKPATEKPATEKPATEKPATEKPVTEKPVTEKPTATERSVPTERLPIPPTPHKTPKGGKDVGETD